MLEYENKNGEKLHGIAGIPFLTRLLVEESKGVKIPALDIGGLVTLKSVPKLKRFKRKFIAGAAAVVVGGGGE